MNNFDLKSYLSNNPLLTEAEDAEKVLASTPDEIEAALAAALKMSPDELEKKILSGKDGKEKLDESLTFTLALLIPAILNLVGGISNQIKKKFGLTDVEKEEYKKLKQQIKDIKKKYDLNFLDTTQHIASQITPKLVDQLPPEKRQALDYIKKIQKEIDEKFGSKFGEGAKELGHKWHHAYTFPIVQFLRLLSVVPGSPKFLKDKKKRQKFADILYLILMIGLGYTHTREGLVNIFGGHTDALHVADTVANGYKTGLSFAEIAGEALTAAGMSIEAGAELT